MAQFTKSCQGQNKNSSEVQLYNVLKCTKSVLDVRKNPSPVPMGICLTSRLLLKVANKHNMYPNFPQEKNTRSDSNQDNF